MNEYEPALVVELERLAPPSPLSPDWEDVLARAGHRARPHQLLRPVVLAVVLGLVAAPTLALGGGPLRSLFGTEKRPLQFVGDLQPVAGSGAGTFVAEPNVAIFRLPRNSQLGRRGAFAQSVIFTLRVHNLSGPATSARIVVAAPLRGEGRASTVRLCGPCATTTTGVVRARDLMLALLTGRATVVVTTKAHPDGELRGWVRPRK